MSEGQPALYSILWAIISSWSYGYHMSELNFPAASLTCLAPAFPPPSRLPLCLGLDSTKYGLVTAAFAAGGLAGSLGSSWLVQREGIKSAIMWTGYLNLIGAVLESLAAQWTVLAAGRLMSGVSCGMAVCFIPPFLALIARCSPELANRSGQVGTFHQIGIVLGLFSAQAAGLSFTGSKGDVPGNWRYVTFLTALASLMQIVIGQFYLIDWASEHQVVPTEAISHPAAEFELPAEEGTEQQAGDDPDAAQKALLSNPAPVHEQQLPLREVLSNSALRGPALLTMVIFILQGLSGMNAVMFYSTPVLRPIMPSAAATIGLQITFINVVMTIVALVLIDVQLLIRVGRKRLILGSVTGMGITSLSLAYSLNNELHALAAGSIIIFIVSFAIGLGPVPWLLLSELVPPPAAPAVAALSLSASWLTNFVLASAFLPLRDAMSSPADPRDPLSHKVGEGTVFYLFTGIAVLTWVLLWRSLRG